jgi:capsule biosynthesis phosphatase
MKKLIVDLDDTLSTTINGDYVNSQPILPVITKLKEYKKLGFEIIIQSSRNMRTYKSNVGKINIYTLPNIISWLNKYDIPFDEIYIGKPWCGFDGFYIDDKAVRPSEFVNNSYEQIQELLQKEKSKLI